MLIWYKMLLVTTGPLVVVGPVTGGWVGASVVPGNYGYINFGIFF